MFIIESIEDGVAVLEDGGGDRVSVPAPLLPEGVKEGDMLRAENGLYVILTEETEKRRDEMNGLLHDLWE